MTTHGEARFDPGVELIDIVDELDTVVGVTSRREMRTRRLRHRAAYVLVFNSRGQLFVHRRTATKDVYPSFYDVAVGGVVETGETYEGARRHGLAVYGTFVFGYDHDTAETIAETVDFARQQGLFLAAFNHVTPFPGTPLYERLEQQGRLLFDRWWLDGRYRYNMIPYRPHGMEAAELARRCLQARRQFYSWPSMLGRLRTRVNRRNLWMLRNFLAINTLHQLDIEGRSGMPLGDERWNGQLLKAQ